MSARERRTGFAIAACEHAFGAWSLGAILAAVLAACGRPTPMVRDAAWPRPAHGAVVSEHPLATRVGLEILDRGGNAADAAVATALALAVVYPQAGNLGGGGFALWVAHRGEARALDFREVAPAAADARRYLDRDGRRVDERSLRGPLAVGVPGTPAGLFDLYRTRGSGLLAFQDLVAPAIALARDGFEVDAWLARDLAASSLPTTLSESGRALWFPGGRALAEGHRLVQSELARTLTEYARGGADGFYRGRAGTALVRALAAAPIPAIDRGGEIAATTGEGWITAQDLAAYECIERAPLRGWFRGLELVTMPPPSAGGIVLLQMLGVLEGLPLDHEREKQLALERLDAQQGRRRARECAGLSERMVHWWIETARGSYADRAEHLGDPEFVKEMPVSALLSSRVIASRRVAIGENAAPDVGPWREPSREGQQTTHLSVLDVQGNAVSLTTTLNTTFGSGLWVDGAGFFLNNELDDFAILAGSPNVFGLVGSAANALVPGKRPLSSMCPTVVREGGNANLFVLGSPGGPRIVSAVAQVLLRTILFDQSLEAAVCAPRLHQQWSPTQTYFEAGFDAEIVDALAERRGHAVERDVRPFGSVQAIRLARPGAEPVAVSDPRRGGVGGVQGQALGLPARPPISAVQRDEDPH